MHALQLLPIAAILLELLGRRVPLFADGRLRFSLIALATASYAAIVGLATWQALAGQSVVRPEGVILLTGLGAAVAAILLAVALVLRAARPARA
ncbi:MAG: hypothetical protein JWP66_1577 [Naasia sp.]|jgi:hypothetical protein|nr:hypothetical protein [Naasia sp.]